MTTRVPEPRPLCDAGRCVWPGDTSRPSVAAGGLSPSVPLPQYAIEPAQAMFRFGPSHRGFRQL